MPRMEPEILVEIERVSEQARLAPHEIAILTALVSGVEREHIAPGVPRDTVKIWVRSLLRKTGTPNSQSLALLILRGAWKHRRAAGGPLAPEVERLTREFASEIQAVLTRTVTEEIARALAPGPVADTRKR
jgi:hypothetical protein